MPSSVCSRRWIPMAGQPSQHIQPGFHQMTNIPLSASPSRSVLESCWPWAPNQPCELALHTWRQGRWRCVWLWLVRWDTEGRSEAAGAFCDAWCAVVEWVGGMGIRCCHDRTLWICCRWCVSVSCSVATTTTKKQHQLHPTVLYEMVMSAKSTQHYSWSWHSSQSQKFD